MALLIGDADDRYKDIEVATIIFRVGAVVALLLFAWKYEWIHKMIGGRPWTYIIRDFYHGNPVGWTLLLFTAGYFLEPYIGFYDYVKIGVGILLGHLFWGAPWIPDQPDDIVKKYGKWRKEH